MTTVTGNDSPLIPVTFSKTQNWVRLHHDSTHEMMRISPHFDFAASFAADTLDANSLQ
jgi:hypothetical protein